MWFVVVAHLLRLELFPMANTGRNTSLQKSTLIKGVAYDAISKISIMPFGKEAVVRLGAILNLAVVPSL